MKVIYRFLQSKSFIWKHSIYVFVAGLLFLW
jgi:hypothetical protein